MSSSPEANSPAPSCNRKLVVLGIPWDVDTEGLSRFMSKYGELSDCIVMRDRVTGRSRGFGYVTFATTECAEKALNSSHFLNGRMLDVKVATPKEAMPQAPTSARKSSRIFVARIPLTVTDDDFKSYFEKYGVITDVYMPKDRGSNAHRGIGFITFEDPDAVDTIMNETHELGGGTIAIDRATPKEETDRNVDKLPLPYGVFNSYLNAAARLGLFAMPSYMPFEYPGYGFPRGGPPGPHRSMSGGRMHHMHRGKGNAEHEDEHDEYVHRKSSNARSRGSKPLGKKIFVGRIPFECTAEEVRSYFSKFGSLTDVYLPKDREKTTHRGFGFVTFADESSVEQIADRPHELRGQMLAIDHAAPIGEVPPSSYHHSMGASHDGERRPGPMRGGYGGGYNPWGMYDSLPPPNSKMEPRYRPY